VAPPGARCGSPTSTESPWRVNYETRGTARSRGFLDDYQRPGTEIADGLAVLDHPLHAASVADRLDVEQIIIIGGALSWESQRHLAELVTRPDRRVEAWVSPTVLRSAHDVH
jgi:hypothetical protein